MDEKKLADILVWNDRTTEYIMALLRKVSQHKEVVIFGAGTGGKQTLQLLEAHNAGEKVKAFSDNNTGKIGACYCGRLVLSPVEVVQLYKNSLILVSSTAFDVIKNQLIKLNIEEKNIYFFQPAGISLNENEDKKFIKDNLGKFEAVYERLADEESKLVYCSILNYRISKSVEWLDNMRDVILPECEQYFDKRLLKEYSFEKAFVDAGACIGDTWDNFCREFPDWTGKYYFLEANPDIYQKLYVKVEGAKQVA